MIDIQVSVPAEGDVSGVAFLLHDDGWVWDGTKRTDHVPPSGPVDVAEWLKALLDQPEVGVARTCMFESIEARTLGTDCSSEITCVRIARRPRRTASSSGAWPLWPRERLVRGREESGLLPDLPRGPGVGVTHRVDAEPLRRVGGKPYDASRSRESSGAKGSPVAAATASFVM